MGYVANVKRRNLNELRRDSAVLDLIAAALDGEELSAESCEIVAAYVRNSGRPVRSGDELRERYAASFDLVRRAS